MEEIKRSCPDVVCLQGVDQFDYFQEKLSPSGFIGIHERTEQPSLLKNVYFGDGLAVFWRTERFKLVGRKRVVLGDDRYVSNIALVARLKRHDPFLKADNMEYLQNPINVEHEGMVQVDAAIVDPQSTESALQSVWMVLSNHFVYLFRHRQQYHCPLRHFDLDHFCAIKETSDDLNDHSFAVIPKGKTPDGGGGGGGAIRFHTNDPSATTKWIQLLKEAQVGTEIDVWTSQLIHGYSENTEFRRIKQCQELQEHIARVSATDKLPQRFIGYRHRASDGDVRGRKGDGTSSGGGGGGGAAVATKDLSEMFRKMMMNRISKEQAGSVPVGGGPVEPTPIKAMVIDPNVHHDDDRKDPEEETPCGGGDGDGDKVETKKKPSSSSCRSGLELSAQSESGGDWLTGGKWSVPTKLWRPVVLCIDTESNAWGDAMHEIPPLCYTYLTKKSRTTTQNPLYQHSLQRLAEDPAHSLQRHSWFLQSAYALGFGEEPELTSFSRFWPAVEVEEKRSGNTFADSVEVIRCSDLVLFSPQHFRVLKLQENVSKEWVYSKRVRTLPNADYPSDHTLIGVDFELAFKNKVKSAIERAAKKLLAEQQQQPQNNNTATPQQQMQPQPQPPPQAQQQSMAMEMVRSQMAAQQQMQSLQSPQLQAQPQQLMAMEMARNQMLAPGLQPQQQQLQQAAPQPQAQGLYESGGFPHALQQQQQQQQHLQQRWTEGRWNNSRKSMGIPDYE